MHGVGTDVELISSIPADNENFLARNFTEGELAYCRAAPDFRASLAGRWSAKEAVFKSLKVESKGAGASLKEIEICATPAGPTVLLHGEAKRVAEAQGVKKFELSLSHSDDVVSPFPFFLVLRGAGLTCSFFAGCRRRRRFGLEGSRLRWRIRMRGLRMQLDLWLHLRCLFLARSDVNISYF